MIPTRLCDVAEGRENTMDYNKRKKLYIFGGAGIALIIIVIVFCIAFASCSADSYEEHYDAAEAAFMKKDYEEAISELEKALDIEASEECYLLMADIYMAQDDIDMAIQVLYLGYSRVGSDELSQRLDELKAIKNGGGTSQNTVSIGGVEIKTDASSLVLSGKMLTDSDLNDLSQLTSLESLSLSDNKLSNLAPLSQLSALTFLDVSGNGISDISALSDLALLKTLYLDGNPVQDLSPLYELKALRTLSMKNIAISSSQMAELKSALPDCKIYVDSGTSAAEEISIGGKTFLSDVTELNLEGLGISDISQLSKCKKLVKLDLRNNNISDISPLADMPDLEWLCIWNNQITDLSPLIGLSNLKYIDADGNKIGDLAVLSALGSLEELWLSDNEFEGDIGVLGNLSNLRRLGLKGSSLEDEDLDVLMNLSSLTELALENNPDISANKMDELKATLPGCSISHSELLYSVEFGGKKIYSDATEINAVSCGVIDLSGLDKFSQLQSLILTGNSVSDLSPLSGLKELEVLELYGNKVSNLSPLEGLSSLRVLNLLNNNVTDVSALAGCTGLEELHLSFNGISDISPLASCFAIKELDLDANNLSDISALAALTSLNSLSLENNNISDLSPLYTLTLLDTLYIRGNPVSAEQIASLQQILPNCTVVSDFNFESSGDPNPESSDPADLPEPPIA